METTTRLRAGAAVLIALHGIMHWPGFAVPWQMLTLKGIPYGTAILGGGVDPGGDGIRFFGLIWLAVLVLFVAAGVAIWLRRSWAMPLTAGSAMLSLVLSLLNEPLSWEGVIVDLVILAAIAGQAWRSSRTAGIPERGRFGPA